MHLQQRQVLQRSGVEHHLGSMDGEHLVHALGVAQVGDDEVGIVEQRPAFERGLRRMQRRFVPVQHDQFGRSEEVDLPAELAVDRATGPGDQHPLAGHVAGHRLQIGVDLPAAQQVGFGHRPDVGHPDRRVRATSCSRRRTR